MPRAEAPAAPRRRTCARALRSPRVIAIFFALLGLGLAALVTGALGTAAFLSQALRTWPLQIASGAVVVLVVAWLGAPRTVRPSAAGVDWLRAVSLPALAFLAGSAIASLVDLVLYGDPFSAAALPSYVIAPLFWLSVFGLPICLLLGIAFGRTLRLIEGHRDT